MYDLAWSRGIVREWGMLCTRAQLIGGQFDAFVVALGLREKIVSFEDALTYTVAASQHDKTAARAWNELKRLAKRPPCRQFVSEDCFRTILILGLHKGKAWKQGFLDDAPNLT